MIRRVTYALLIVCTLLLFTSCVEIGGYKDDLVSENEFIDDIGNRVIVEKPYRKIISMDSVHTYNLFYIGAGDSIIGVDDKSVFPIQAMDKQRYSLDVENDITRIIEAQPDVVIITPKINRDNTEFVTALEVNDINVISIMPDDFSEFSSYITKLGIICGMKEKSQKALDNFYCELSDIESMTSGIEQKTKVFFESDEKFYATPSKDSLPYIMMQYAGAKNIAGAKRPMVYGEMDARYGLDKILENKDDIDVYLTLRGSGASLISISQKSEFRNIDAIKNGKAYEIPKELVSEYSFRLLDGAKQIARLCYPEYMDSIEDYKNDQPLTRESFSKIVYNMLHMQSFVNSNSDYYEYKRYGHTYATFLDVDFNHDDFDIIETVCMHSYLDIDDEVFDRGKTVDKSDLAMFFNIIFELDDKKNNYEIVDVDNLENKVVIEKVVANELLDTAYNAFEPYKVYTNNEFIEILAKAVGEKYD